MRVPHQNSLLLGLMLIVLLSLAARSVHAEEQPSDDQLQDGVKSGFLPELPRKALPPRDCWSCFGPPARQPCFDSHRGFLYYGTRATDDDPVNGFCDCPRGNCGYLGAQLTLAWIGLHPKHRRAKQVGLQSNCPHCGHVPHYFRYESTPHRGFDSLPWMDIDSKPLGMIGGDGE